MNGGHHGLGAAVEDDDAVSDIIEHVRSVRGVDVGAYRERLEVSRAGDPPPLLLRPGGSVERVGDGGSRPLGYGRQPRHHTQPGPT